MCKSFIFYELQRIATADPLTVLLTVQHEEIVRVTPTQFIVPASSDNFKQIIIVDGLSPGHVEVNATVLPDNKLDQKDLFIKILVANSYAVILVAITVGWLYFCGMICAESMTNFKFLSCLSILFHFTNQHGVWAFIPRSI